MGSGTVAAARLGEGRAGSDLPLLMSSSSNSPSWPGLVYLVEAALAVTLYPSCPCKAEKKKSRQRNFEEEEHNKEQV